MHLRNIFVTLLSCAISTVVAGFQPHYYQYALPLARKAVGLPIHDIDIASSTVRGGTVTKQKKGFNFVAPTTTHHRHHFPTKRYAISAPPSGDSSGEEWTKSRIHNKSWFRSLALMLAIALVGCTTNGSPMNQFPSKAAAFIHLIAYSTWFGTAIYTTFILGLTMFKNLPRQTFGKLQSKLFPKYFSLCSSMILVQFFTLNSLPLGMSKRVVWSLGSALSATLFNQLYLEPYSTKIMLERYDLENTDGGQDTDRYKFLKSTFGKMHGISSLSNLIALCGGIAYGFILSSLLAI